MQHHDSHENNNDMCEIIKVCHFTVVDMCLVVVLLVLLMVSRGCQKQVCCYHTKG